MTPTRRKVGDVVWVAGSDLPGLGRRGEVHRFDYVCVEDERRIQVRAAFGEVLRLAESCCFTTEGEALRRELLKLTARLEELPRLEQALRDERTALAQQLHWLAEQIAQAGR